MGLKLFISAVAAVLLISCRKTETPEEQLENRFGVEAVIISGENRATVQLIRLDTVLPVLSNQNLTVKMRGPGTEYVLEQTAADYFLIEAPEPPFYADAPYELEIEGEDILISASTVTPPEFDWINTPANQFKLDPSNPDAILDVVSWEILDDFEYLLKLDFLGDEPDPIPFASNSYNFFEAFAQPIPESGIPLYAGYFENYGTYRITVYAVSKEYVAYFFASAQGGLPLLESNINGAFGYFTGMKSINFEFNISG